MVGLCCVHPVGAPGRSGGAAKWPPCSDGGGAVASGPKYPCCVGWLRCVGTPGSWRPASETGDGPAETGLCGNDTPAASRSVSASGTSSSVTGFGPALGVTPPKLWTAGSSGFNSGCGGSSRFGFDSLGSLPSLIALTIRAAFHFAYLIFCCVSWSTGPQMLATWKNVAAASKVVAVCLHARQRVFWKTGKGFEHTVSLDWP